VNVPDGVEGGGENPAGVNVSENAGMSNEKRGEIPLRRKSKVSSVKVVF
jgi:hypothetical protein